MNDLMPVEETMIGKYILFDQCVAKITHWDGFHYIIKWIKALDGMGGVVKLDPRALTDGRWQVFTMRETDLWKLFYE